MAWEDGKSGLGVGAPYRDLFAPIILSLTVYNPALILPDLQMRFI